MASPHLRTHWSRQKGVCRYCKRPVPFEDATIDHVVPRSRGGATKGNIVMACWQCNNRKGDMPADQFVAMLHNEPDPFDPRPRLTEARLQMWMKADGLRCLEERA
jgi:5-methylcytosine-specific restriction endonuclease McrA